MQYGEHIVALIQTAIGPVILISGLGLLLLTMTNRLGRIIDRSRALSCDMDRMDAGARARLASEIDILWSRARLIRVAIMSACLSCLSASLLVIVLFLAPLVELDIPLLVTFLFVAAMLCLIVSLIGFLLDVNRTLSALHIELEAHRELHNREDH
ncbi:MAG: DUF2721 domain-containing protein [Prosthecochloris sp.]|uniref:DUF2721 domain-containing protein n=1 Tax=Prosthecochloris sp. ZM_2 TaxID=2045206 RepID=UPI000DF756B3|nr:DUF2721 domain-containing protein [Prosthecochloris sp. ZM_2]MEC9486625.1 DUF2721 domain-containing protein [Prosthecochloris sp.]RNA65230.1 DUF2721 domain-containing protein [Prosthecochloris sp. ZM_2]